MTTDNAQENIENSSPKMFTLKYRIIAVFMIFVFTFQTLQNINSHTYSIGIDNFHTNCMPNLTCCFGHSYHSLYKCGTPHHIDTYNYKHF